jgi:hypothetical protein
MSYNIDNWKTKKLEGLVIPLDAFFIHEREDWHPKLIFGQYGDTLNCGCEQEIKGFLKGGNFHVGEFNMSGEGSGTFYNWILEPALTQSTGKLDATLIWEGGDSVTRLTVINGELKSENIDL